MNFSVNVDALFWGKNIYEAIEKLAENNVKNIEFWGWEDKDFEKLLSLKGKYDLNYVGICPRLTSMVDPAYKETYLKDLQDTVEAAKKLGCTGIFVKPGDKTQDSFENQYSNMFSILEAAAQMTEGTDITILLEPVSFLEAPETFLGTSDLAFEMVEKINHPQLKVLYDFYHMQLDEGDVVRRVASHLSSIGHLHAAGIADRHELGDGELDYGYVFEKIQAAGYDRLIGLEYFPTKNPVEEVKQVIFEAKYR